jgi:hypothetical protein
MPEPIDYNFLLLPLELQLAVFGYLDIPSLLRSGLVSKRLNTLCNVVLFDQEIIEDKTKKVEFYLPIVTKIDDRAFHNLETWQHCKKRSVPTYRRFYRTQNHLFRDPDNQHAKGCYKVKLCFFDITQKNIAPSFDLASKSYDLAKSLSPDEIVSYNFKNSDVEYSNPFYNIT